MSTISAHGVSTIIPVFNRSAMLREAVASVLAQTWRPIEIIIVDDGSTDDTPHTAQELAEHHSGTIHVVRQGNAGPGVARNTGLRHAQGQFIQYLDSDDLLEPRKFELQVDSLRQTPEADVSYCITLRRDSQTGQMKPWAQTASRIEKIFPEFLPKRGWATLTPLWRRSACDRIGPWSNLRVMEDWEHDLRAGILGIQPVQVNETLCHVRDHDGNRASGIKTGYTPDVMRNVFRAREAIWHLMLEHGLTDWTYLEEFGKTMFWVARMCGERGLTTEATQALHYAETIYDFHERPRMIRLFRQLTRVVGWKAAVMISERSRSTWRRIYRPSSSI